MAGRRRIRPPSHKLTIYIPLKLMEALEKYTYEKKNTMTDIITELLRERLTKEGYYSDEKET